MVELGTAPATRRDFLYVATAAAGAVGSVMAAWPFINQMNPSANVRSLSSIEVDLSPIDEGQQITVTWRSKPLFVRRRTKEEVQKAAADLLDQLIDPLARNANLPENAPATDQNRTIRPEWLIVIGVCTHLGCVPSPFEGNWAGWLCHCHASQYDTAGRVRVGPAPRNLDIPRYAFLSETRIRVG